MIPQRFHLVEGRRVQYHGEKALIDMAGIVSAWRVHHDVNKPSPNKSSPNKSWPGAMSLSADDLYKMSDVELLAAYLEARRQSWKRSSRAIQIGRGWSGSGPRCSSAVRAG